MLLGKWQEIGGRKEEKKKISRVVIYSSFDLCGKIKDKFIRLKKGGSIALIRPVLLSFSGGRMRKTEVHLCYFQRAETII